MAKLMVKRFSSPDERRPFVDKGHADILEFGEGSAGRAVFEAGWKWSKHVGPIAGTRSCMAEHSGYVVQGKMHLVMDDGQEGDIEAGDCFYIPPGHDAWTLGNEACICLDFTGMGQYARPAAERRTGAGAEQQPGVH